MVLFLKLSCYRLPAPRGFFWCKEPDYGYGSFWQE